MRASEEQIDALRRIDEIDREAIKLRKKLDRLPQRAVILKARKDCAAIKQKAVAIEEMRKKAKAALTKLEDEESALTRKQQEIEEILTAVKGDYRSVEARSKELAGVTRRLGEVSEALSEARERCAKVDSAKEKAEEAIGLIEGREAEAIASFKEEGGALKASLDEMIARRDALLSSLPAEMAKAYEKAAGSCGGIALAWLKEGRCTTCRSGIDDVRVRALRRGGELGTCPACSRLIVVAPN